MDAIRLLRSELRRSLHGPAWHGPALLEALGDVDVEEAGRSAVPGAHTIAELAAHALAWIEEVARRMDGEPAALPQRGDWPGAAGLDERGWAALREEIIRAGDALDGRLAALPPERLLARVGGADAPLGSGVSYAVMLHGLAQHNAYHGGQVALLKRALRG